MFRLTMPRPLASLLAIALGGCALYERHAHGWVVRSKLDAGLATPVTLAANAPSISQRFRPADIATDGAVSRSLVTPLFGRRVRVDHGRADAGYRLQARYPHLSERLVREGETVRRGQLLGYSGMSSLAAGFPRLHLEVYRFDDAEPPRAVGFLDPQLFRVDGVGGVTCLERDGDYPETPVRRAYPVPCRGLAWR